MNTSNSNRNQNTKKNGLIILWVLLLSILLSGSTQVPVEVVSVETLAAKDPAIAEFLTGTQAPAIQESPQPTATSEPTAVPTEISVEIPTQIPTEFPTAMPDLSLPLLQQAEDKSNPVTVPPTDGSKEASEKLKKDEESEADGTATLSPGLSGQTLDIPLFNTIVNMDMPKNNNYFWFIIPEGTVLGDDTYLNLHLTISNTLLAHRSTITVIINDVNIETQWIRVLSDQNVSWWKVQIPVKYLRIGEVNGLAISTMQRSIEDYCADYDNPANWVRFDTDSYLHLDVQEMGVPSLGTLYQYYYDNFYNKESIETEFVLPDASLKFATPAMLKAASAVGMMNPYKDGLNFPVSYGKDSQDLVANKIFVGAPQSFPQAEGLLLPEALNANEGYLSVHSMEDPIRHKMLISGLDEIGLDKAVKFFTNTEYLNQIEAQELKVQTDVESPNSDKLPNASGFYILKDFGYTTEISLAGAFHQSVTFTIHQPNNVQSRSDSYIRLLFRHSRVLYSEKSVLSLYINGSAIDSAKLSSANADAGELKVAIPKEALTQETITLRVDVYNYLMDIDCDLDYYDSAWTIIDNESEIFFGTGDTGVEPTLAGFPSFLSFSDNNATDIAIGIPGDYTNDDLEISTLLAVLSGQSNHAVFDYLFTQDPQEYKSLGSLSNMIIQGTFENISLPQEVQDALLVVPLGSGQFKIKEGITVSPETLRGKVLLQVIRSPWNFYRKIYVLCYEEGAEGSVKTILKSASNTNGLGGQLAVYDSKGRYRTYSLTGESTEGEFKSEKAPLTLELINAKIKEKLGVPWWLPALALLIIVILIIILIRVIKSHSRFTTKAEQIRKENDFNQSDIKQASDTPIGEVNYDNKDDE